MILFPTALKVISVPSYGPLGTGGRYGYHGVSTIIFAAVGCIDVVPIPPNNYDSCMRAEIRPLYRYRLAAFDRPVCLFRCHAKGELQNSGQKNPQGNQGVKSRFTKKR